MAEDLRPILNDFEITPEADQGYSEEEVLALLTQQIEWLMAHRTEFLFSLLYRLDVDERQVRRVLDLAGEGSPAEGLARLVLDRQKARLRTKRDVRVDPIDEDLAW